MFGLGTTELVIILVLVLVIFGAGKLPEIGGALGKGLRSFRKAASDAEEAIEITPQSDEEKEKARNRDQDRK